MPQGDFQNFGSTVYFLGISFVFGYFMFVSFWAPKFLLVLKTRNWLKLVNQSLLTGNKTHQNHRRSLSRTIDVSSFLASSSLFSGLLSSTSPEIIEPTYIPLESNNFPELFLMFVQFSLLIVLISGLSVESIDNDTQLVQAQPKTIEVANPQVLLVPVENLFFLWSKHREDLFFKSSSATLTSIVNRILLNLTQEELNSGSDISAVQQRLKAISKGISK